MGLLGGMTGMCLMLSETIKLFPKWINHFAFPPAVYGSSICSTSPSTLAIVFFHTAILVGCVVIVGCNLI